MYRWNRNLDLSFEYNKVHYNIDKDTVIITQFGNCGSKGSVIIKQDAITQTIKLGESHSNKNKLSETQNNDKEEVLVATRNNNVFIQSHDFYAYKMCKCGSTDIIVKLFIGKTSRVAKAFSETKMRTDEALVVNMWKIVENDFVELNEDEIVLSLHDNTFYYRKNDIVRPKEAFNVKLDTVCVSGIHFFLKPEQALKYKNLNYENKNFSSIINYELLND
jgi:hypothetical protein